ncbi:uncharacterized protein BDZ99DRAFT_416672 [Mytilinidion resinicola]|uniref:Chitin biosynthesis protein n=1 Tax=Mytilinidion resinicola TaxID=574789 RepID=A0A6A6YPA8_9PEZI|nr:uncharacterized protein BDZ99DRAFT_416672 [Mytilinidion resinicola]KAF2810358.1 hypothetical protein BDZ99DRAFT_416672 [Mytilinidion resinicola]
MLVSLTVGKVDAGVAVLLTEDKRLIEFPSILLPPDISSGSIVDITVSRNHESESRSASAFHNLQSTIYRTFGQKTPSPPVLRCRNATQTSVVLEWDPIDIATASLRGLTLYRNGSKAGTIPNPREVHSTKLSGLAVDTEYTFHLVLRTSAGTYSSEKLKVMTHKMTELSGITITPGQMPAALRESLNATVQRIGAKIVDTVRIDTTHFICTDGRGQAWEKAVENNIPVVVPDWIKGCEREGRLVGVRGYYLNADPRLRQVGPGVGAPQQQLRSPQQPQPSPTTQVTPPTPERATASQRGSIASDVRQSGSEEDTPPPPPPKFDPETEKVSNEASEPKTATDEQKVRTSDLKPSSPSVEDEEESSEEEEDEGGDEKAVEAGLPVREKQGEGSKTPEDDKASFHDVSL